MVTLEITREVARVNTPTVVGLYSRFKNTVTKFSICGESISDSIIVVFLTISTWFE